MPPLVSPSEPVRAPAALPNQFALLRQRRFAAFFWTQFLGAANDNLFKIALVIWVTYQVQVAWLPPAMAGLVVGAIFILPISAITLSSAARSTVWKCPMSATGSRNFTN